MSFNPLGNFNPNAAIDPIVANKARALLHALPQIPSGLIDRAYFHWTVGPLGMCFADYNIEARYTGAWQLTTTHDPRDNAPGLNDNPEASHTWLRNTGAVGVAITGMDGANPHDFGLDPVTVAGLTHLCAAMAAVTVRYGIDVAGQSTSAPYAEEHTLLTHAEAAMLPGNPPPPGAYNYGITGSNERWDLATFCALPAGMSLTAEMAATCGDALRTLTRAYKVAIA